MTITAQSFRVTFPEFADGAVYLTSAIEYYIRLAGKMLNNPRRWGTALDDGQMLFVAHHLVLEKQAMEAAANGADPGVGASGPVNQKSVDKVSVGYDTSAGVDKEAGHWNLTVYGVRLKAMINMFGAGPLMVGIGCAPPGTLSSQEAWAGPPVFNFPNDSG